jgi:hypothetical protein
MVLDVSFAIPELGNHDELAYWIENDTKTQG